MRKYKVIPFLARVKAGARSKAIANQLEELIISESSPEWEFVEVCDVNAKVSPGCMGFLMGQREGYLRYDLVIFKSKIADA